MASLKRRIVVVVPTYNEVLNLEDLVCRLLNVSTDLDVLIVDDGSPDGTGRLAEELSLRFVGRVAVLPRKGKQGRGNAVLAGFRQGLASSQCELFVEMDADLSHQPEELPQLIDAARYADVVVASRSIAGGMVVGWDFPRRIWSRMANAIIQTALRLPIHDQTNGYRLYRLPAVETLATAHLFENGFIALSEWALVLHRAGFRFSEVPSTFIDRRHGKSNMSVAEAAGAIKAVFRMMLIRSGPVRVATEGPLALAASALERDVSTEASPGTHAKRIVITEMQSDLEQSSRPLDK